MKIKASNFFKIFACVLFFASNTFAVTNIVAAENFYGELAHEIGGNSVRVQSIISNPNADPHLFATSPSVNKLLEQAQIVIYSGDGYDPWMEQLIATLDSKKVTIINVAKLVNVQNGSNPHIWYKNDAFPKLAIVLATTLGKKDPHNAIMIKANLTNFLEQHQQLVAKIAKIKAKYNGTYVTATEPVYGYMAENMGLIMLGEDFQWKIMNNAEPSPQMMANYENLLKSKKAKILFYNNQVIDPITTNMKNLATMYHIPIIGVSETMPPNTTINAWLNHEVDITNKALQSITSK